MKLPTDPKDQEALEDIIYRNIAAFSSSDLDLENLTEWKADLWVKKGSQPTLT